MLLQLVKKVLDLADESAFNSELPSKRFRSVFLSVFLQLYFSFHFRRSLPYQSASPSFQLPRPPPTTNAGHTPAFLRNGGRARWRAEEDVEDTLLDEAVASALTPGIKRPKAGASERSKKILRKGMRLL